MNELPLSKRKAVKNNGKLKKKKKPTLSKVKKKTWDLFSVYIRLRDALETTGTDHTAICCTCKRPYPAFGKGCLQAGHFLPGRKNVILFEKTGVHAQCYNCNVNLKGNWPAYYKFMKEKYGLDEIERLLGIYYNVKKYTIHELEDLQMKLKNEIKQLKTKITAE